MVVRAVTRRSRRLAPARRRPVPPVRSFIVLSPSERALVGAARRKVQSYRRLLWLPSMRMVFSWPELAGCPCSPPRQLDDGDEIVVLRK